MKSGKLCFIAPKYSASADTHFNYLYRLVFLLEKELDIFLIVEKGDRPDFLKNTRIYVQKFKIFPLRIIENFLAILFVKLSGYRDSYVHYSFVSALNSSLIDKFCKGRTFYWNCGLPWLYRRNYFREKLEWLVYQLVTYLVTGAQGLKADYASHYQLPLSKIKVLPNWIDLDRFQSRLGYSGGLKSQLNIFPGEKVVLFTHRLSKRKGVHYLPEIANSLKNENAILLIAGDGPERKNLESRIQNLELSSRVRFLGRVPNNKIQDYFRIADLFILPSEEEGFPHVLLEAMAAGVPFVAFDAGGIKEISPPEVFRCIVSKNDPKIFAEKIRELLRADSKKLEDIKLSELNWVKQFDIKIAVKRFKQLFT